jgi:hypothetical protein
MSFDEPLESPLPHLRTPAERRLTLQIYLPINPAARGGFLSADESLGDIPQIRKHILKKYRHFGGGRPMRAIPSWHLPGNRRNVTTTQKGRTRRRGQNLRSKPTFAPDSSGVSSSLQLKASHFLIMVDSAIAVKSVPRASSAPLPIAASSPL